MMSSPRGKFRPKGPKRSDWICVQSRLAFGTMRNCAFSLKPLLLKLSAGAAVFTSCMMTSGLASADIGEEGTFAIGFERLFGFYQTNAEIEDNDFGITRFSFLYTGAPRQTPYSRPRAGVDYFIIDNLSVGGGAGFYMWSDEDDDNNDDNDRSGTGFLFAPRVGYFFNAMDGFGIWPRGGFTFVSDRDENGNGDGDTSTASALSFQIPFIIVVADPVAINLELDLDMGLGGEIDRDNQPDLDQKYDEYGVHFGVVGFF